MSQNTKRGAQGGILGRIADLLGGDGLTCHVVFVSRKKTDATTRREKGRRHDFDLVGMNPRSRAYDEIVGRYKRFVKERQEWRPIPLATGDDGGEPPEGSYYVERTADVPFQEEHLAEPGEGWQAGFDKKFISRIAALQFRFERGGDEAVFIKRFTPGKIFKHKKRTAFRFKDGGIDIASDDVVDLPEGCDCCVFGDYTLIFDRAHYENMFDHHVMYEAVHKKVFEHFRKKSDFEIVDIDRLESQTLSDPRKLRKFSAIVKRGIWGMPFDQIRKFLEERTIPSVTVTTSPNRIAFKDSGAMIHFLNDAHLDSKATGRPYLASSKTEE